MLPFISLGTTAPHPPPCAFAVRVEGRSAPQFPRKDGHPPPVGEGVHPAGKRSRLFPLCFCSLRKKNRRVHLSNSLSFKTLDVSDLLAHDPANADSGSAGGLIPIFPFQFHSLKSVSKIRRREEQQTPLLSLSHPYPGGGGWGEGGGGGGNEGEGMEWWFAG
eukprot:Hpha_TRINITY_DN11896_c0_g1::TRINITY_DN11896_c0_g1_i1::g.1920::m.1920